MTTARRHSAGFTVLLSCLLLGSFVSCSAGEATSALQHLQGTWESVNAEPGEEVTITIEGNSLYFYKNADFWWDTTFTLPADGSHRTYTPRFVAPPRTKAMRSSPSSRSRTGYSLWPVSAAPRAMSPSGPRASKARRAT